MKSFAFVFPGQGSQSVGMLHGWGGHPIVVETLQEASDALGEDIGRLIVEGPKETLALTTNTQPVMLVAGVAAWRMWRNAGGGLPVAAAGHSLGEYSALVAADVLTLAQAVPLVRLRAAAMQEAVAVGAGAMAAILGLDAAQVAAGCAKAMALFDASRQEVVEAVNFNDPAQTVIAGTQAAVAQACELLKAAGAKRALPLPVSAPFHSRLMKPAAEKLKVALQDIPFLQPQFPVVNNVDVAACLDATGIRDALYRQAFSPVRWVDCVRALQSLGATHMVESGPGKVLAGLTKRIDPALVGVGFYDQATLAETLELLA